MTLQEALCIYIYLQHAGNSTREREPAWREACDVIHREANLVMARYEDSELNASVD